MYTLVNMLVLFIDMYVEVPVVKLQNVQSSNYS